MACLAVVNVSGVRLRVFRRYQRVLSTSPGALCQSVNNTDQLIMISNVAEFCCQIINLILVIYCTIFFRHQSISHSGLSAFTYINCLITLLTGLTLTPCQGIIIKHVVSVCATLLCPCPIVGSNAVIHPRVSLFNSLGGYTCMVCPHWIAIGRRHSCFTFDISCNAGCVYQIT